MSEISLFRNFVYLVLKVVSASSVYNSKMTSAASLYSSVIQDVIANVRDAFQVRLLSQFKKY